MNSQPISKILFHSSHCLQEICSAIFLSTPIDFFEYIRVYNDGTYLTACSNTRWIEHFIDKKYFEISDLCKIEYKQQQSDEIIITNTLQQGQEIVKDAAINFDIDHCIVLNSPLANGHESFIFGTKPCNSHIINFYLNNLELLKKFQFYFKDKSRDLLRYQDEINISVHNETVSTAEKMRHDKNIEITNKFITDNTYRYYIDANNDSLYLTKREVECLSWAAEGKTSQEIGLILESSPRTIETHINSIKQKMKCYKLTQLVSEAKKMNLI